MGAWQFFVTFLGWLSDLLERLSDLQLGDQKVTLNHLVKRIFVFKKSKIYIIYIYNPPTIVIPNIWVQEV